MKIVLFGATGMLGRYVLNVLKEYYDVYCISRDNYDIENDSFEKLEDILNEILQKNDVTKIDNDNKKIELDNEL